MHKFLSESTLADATSVAQTTNYTFQAKSSKPIAVQAVWTSTTASFTLTLQYSVDGTNYQDFTTGTAISNSSSNVIWDISTVKDAPYWRVNAARTSGTLTTLQLYVASVPR
jgi:hypothetical protein